MDFTVAAGLTYVVSQVNAAAAEDGGGSDGGGTLVYAPAALFAASGAHGLYKRSRCIQHREKAPPEAWIVDARAGGPGEPSTLSKDLSFGAGVAATAVVNQAAPPRVHSSRSGSSSMTINGHSYSEGRGGSLGKKCSLDNNTCGSGYSCNIVVGNVGQCVPK